jgi:ectoine hydroxylase-related dioxygenase (phytanoyl-CoA dioxygenase family)
MSPTPNPSDRTFIDEHIARVDDQGYTVIENAIDPVLIDELAEAIVALEKKYQIVPATNDFEGRETLRVYNLLAHGEVFTRVPIHPVILAVVEGVLDRECLVSTMSSITIGPGETPQLLHSDDQVIGMPRPHPALVCNTMWALTDFNEANGATRIVPGSHRLDHCPNPTAEYETIPAEMSRGSVLIWHGSLWHGGGANTSDAQRAGLAMNYCAGFIRQQENQQLGIPREIAATFPERLKQLVGYGVYRNLIGHIDKRAPIELLGDDGTLKVIWEN